MYDLKRAKIEYDKMMQKRADNAKEIMDLKAKAKEYGYNLSNKDIYTYARYLPCICGYDKIKSRYDYKTNHTIAKCPVCAFSVEVAERINIQEAWNDAVEDWKKRDK